MNHRPVQRVG
jgi:hypothetical protein